MKRLLKILVLTRPEQRLVIILVLVLVVGAWLKHRRDLQNTLAQPTPTASPSAVEH